MNIYNYNIIKYNMWLKKIFICDKLIYISEQMFIFYQKAYMYEDINRKIIESAFGNVEKPQAFYQLTGTEFEIVMTEIYNKLGYKVERTQSTRDGGKDIIIRKPEILGDFIYYVECKKYAANRHIGIGIIKNLIGTINTDRVNGGILATTSYFYS